MKLHLGTRTISTYNNVYKKYKIWVLIFLRVHGILFLETKFPAMCVMVLYFEPQILYGITCPYAEMSGLIISVEGRYCSVVIDPPCSNSGFIKWYHTAVREQKIQPFAILQRALLLCLY